MRGLSQDDLARLCGISQSAISSYERGERISSKNIFNIAKVLEVDVYWLNGEDRQDTSGISLREDLPWPFPNIEPKSFWALSIKNRAIVEETVAVLIKNLK